VGAGRVKRISPGRAQGLKARFRAAQGSRVDGGVSPRRPSGGPTHLRRSPRPWVQGERGFRSPSAGQQFARRLKLQADSATGDGPFDGTRGLQVGRPRSRTGGDLVRARC